MPAFAYYIPNCKALGQSTLRELNLDRIGEKPLAQNVLVGAGPDGQGGGLIVSHQSECALYLADQQRWECCGPYWIGWNPDDLPSPLDLARSPQIRGSEVVLGDGRSWLCPTWELVPVTFSMFRTGELKTEPVKEMAWLLPVVERVMAVRDGEVVPEDSALLVDACIALSVNYMVGLPEISALRLLNTDTTGVVLSVLVGATKKKVASGAS